VLLRLLNLMLLIRPITLFLGHYFEVLGIHRYFSEGSVPLTVSRLQFCRTNSRKLFLLQICQTLIYKICDCCIHSLYDIYRPSCPSIFFKSVWNSVLSVASQRKITYSSGGATVEVAFIMDLIHWSWGVRVLIVGSIPGYGVQVVRTSTSRRHPFTDFGKSCSNQPWRVTVIFVEQNDSSEQTI
jgi:hypothetical protein